MSSAPDNLFDPALKRKSNPKLRGQTVRHCDSARSNEIARRREVCLSNVGDEVISEISAIGEIEDLKDRLKIRALMNLEVLRYSCIQLEERLASQIVEGCEGALPRT